MDFNLPLEPLDSGAEQRDESNDKERSPQELAPTAPGRCSTLTPPFRGVPTLP